MATMPKFPWHAVVDPKSCYVKQVSEQEWGLAVLVNGEEKIVDFKDDSMSNLFSSEGAAQFALDQIGFIFNYLEEKYALKAKNLRIDPEVESRLRNFVGFTPEPMAPPKPSYPAVPVIQGELLADGDPTAEDVDLVLDLIDEWLTRRSPVGKHCLCGSCRSFAEGVLDRIEARYFKPLPWELGYDIGRARRLIRGE